MQQTFGRGGGGQHVARHHTRLEPSICFQNENISVFARGVSNPSLESALEGCRLAASGTCADACHHLPDPNLGF